MNIDWLDKPLEDRQTPTIAIAALAQENIKLKAAKPCGIRSVHEVLFIFYRRSSSNIFLAWLQSSGTVVNTLRLT